MSAAPAAAVAPPPAPVSERTPLLPYLLSFPALLLFVATVLVPILMTVHSEPCSHPRVP